MNYTYKSFSSDDTLNFAKNLAFKLQKKDVIVLTGELVHEGKILLFNK